MKFTEQELKEIVNRVLNGAGASDVRMDDIKKIRKIAEQCLDEETVEFDTPGLLKFVIDLCKEIEDIRKCLEKAREKATLGIALVDLLRKLLEAQNATD